MLQTVTLQWRKFSKLTKARSAFATNPCVYTQTDSDEKPIRVGKASKGLEARFRGGTGHALDAAMHGSQNLVFVAPVDEHLCELVEGELIWQGRKVLTYNKQGKKRPPGRRLMFTHCGNSPNFSEFKL